jgi:hypothetical protein
MLERLALDRTFVKYDKSLRILVAASIITISLAMVETQEIHHTTY